MYNDYNLLEIDGYTPEKYARNLARFIYPGDEMIKLVLTDDGKAPKQSVNAGRNAIPVEIITIIKNCIKQKFELDSKSTKFAKIWKRCKNSVNGFGRYKNYKEKENKTLNELHQQLHDLMGNNGQAGILTNNNNVENNSNKNN